MAKKIKPVRGKGSNRILEPTLPISTNDQIPIFCLQYLQNDFSITECDKDEKSAFVDTLYKLSRQSWGQLSQRNKHKGGFEKIDLSAIKTGIPDIVTPDTILIAFRFDSMKAMVGFRLGVIFHILWLDRNFTLYKHS